MEELKSFQMGPKQAAAKLQESYDYMISVMPQGKRCQTTITLLEAMYCAISVCRAASGELVPVVHGRPEGVENFLNDAQNCCKGISQDIIDKLRNFAKANGNIL